MWTYQETKLAKHAIVVTKSGFVKWEELVDTLRKRAEHESGEVQADHQNRFSSLHNTLGRLFRKDTLGVSLPGLAYGCGYGKAGVALDHARALFPTLGLTWNMVPGSSLYKEGDQAVESGGYLLCVGLLEWRERPRAQSSRRTCLSAALQAVRNEIVKTGYLGLPI